MVLQLLNIAIFTVERTNRTPPLRTLASWFVFMLGNPVCTIRLQHRSNEFSWRRNLSPPTKQIGARYILVITISTTSCLYVSNNSINYSIVYLSSHKQPFWHKARQTWLHRNFFQIGPITSFKAIDRRITCISISSTCIEWSGK